MTVGSTAHSRPRRRGRRAARHPGGLDGLRASTEIGRTTATAVRAQRLLAAELEALADEVTGLDASMLSVLTQVGAHAAGWLPLDRLHVVNRASLWIFAVDWLVDRHADSVARVDDVVARNIEVLEGRPARDGVAGLLDATRTAVANGALLPDFDDEARRVLGAMRREWDWRDGPAPSPDTYMSNVDSIGLRFAFVTLLAVDGATRADWRPGPGTLSAATDATARVLRMINDLAGFERERAFGDVNLLALGPPAAQVREAIRADTARTVRLLARQPRSRRRWADYLERVLGFNTGLYGTTDYWGER